MDTTKKHRKIIRYNKKKKGDKLVINRVGTFSHYALVNHREIQYNTSLLVLKGSPLNLVVLIYLFYIDSDLFAFVIGCLSTYS